MGERVSDLWPACGSLVKASTDDKPGHVDGRRTRRKDGRRR